MSFLLSDKEQFATLGEVLAFIDSCEAEPSLESDDEGFLLHDVQIGDVSPVDGCTRRHQTRTITKRKRRNLSSSTRLQQCKKAELLLLRKRVLELEGQMNQLQTARVEEFSSTWENLAEEQYHARLQSEAKNRTLKAILAE